MYVHCIVGVGCVLYNRLVQNKADGGMSTLSNMADSRLATWQQQKQHTFQLIGSRGSLGAYGNTPRVFWVGAWVRSAAELLDNIKSSQVSLFKDGENYYCMLDLQVWKSIFHSVNIMVLIQWIQLQ